jgi:uncharacterized membrane protein YhdT
MLLELLKRFIRKVWDKAKSFVASLYHEWESVTILLLATTGLSHIISELPFLISLPLWIESTMVAPVLAVAIVWGLVEIIEWRTNDTAQLCSC